MSDSSTPSVRVVLGALTVGLLTLTACGSDDETSNGGGDAVTTEEFCTRLGELVEIEDATAVAGIQDLAATAPDDIADDMGDFADLFGELVALEDDESDEAQAAFSEKIDEYMELTDRLNIWSNENCQALAEDAFSGG